MFLALQQDIGPNTIWPLPQLDRKVSLVNNKDFYLLDNICPHQKSRIAKCLTTSLQCPYHGMQFTIEGAGIGNQFNLTRHQCYQNQTMLFDTPVQYQFPVDTSYMILKEYRVDSVNATVDVIMDLFLDIPHIPVLHPGVYDQIGITDTDMIKTQTFDNGSIQLVSTQDTAHIIDTDRSYNIGACWMAIYPSTMIEWQPGALFVTEATSDHAVHVFKYYDTRYDLSSYDLNQHVWETAWAQDRVQAENIAELSMKNLDVLKLHHRNWLQNVLQKSMD